MKLRYFALLVFFCITAALGIFLLPWYVPLSRPSRSDSYTYGFNNFAASAWVGLMLAILLGYRLLRKRPQTAFQKALLEILPDGDPLPRRKGLLIASRVMVALVLITITCWFCYVPYAYFGEAVYFISRIEAMILGGVPYRDFNHNYGPGMLYFEHVIYNLAGQRLSVEQAYFIALAFHWAAGLYLIYYILSRLNGRFSRATIFLMLMLPAVHVVTLGLNSAPLRFILPLASLIALHRLVSRRIQGDGKGVWKVCAAAFLVPLANFAVSPEMGLAVWLGCVVYFVRLWWTPLRKLAICSVAVVVALPAVALAFSHAYFESLFSFSSGGYNIPIFPTAHIVLFLIAIFCLLPAIAHAGLSSADARGALALGCCVVTGLLIVAALGRCDYSHLGWNSLGVFLLLLAALSQARSDLFEILAVAYVFVFGVLSFFCMWSDYAWRIPSVISTHKYFAEHPRRASVIRNGLFYSKMLPVKKEYYQLLEYPKVGTPMSVGEDLERFLKLTGKFVIDHRLCPCEDLANQAILEKKLADLRSMEYIVVPAGAVKPCVPINPEAEAQEDSHYFSDLLLFPVRLHPKNSPFDPYKEVRLELQKHFKVIAKCTEDYLIMQREK